MADNFRNILIVLSAIVITAIFLHGLWTIRKQKNPYKLKTSKDKVEPVSRDFDPKGFDQDGVGQVKVLKKAENSDDESAEHVLNQNQMNTDLSKSQVFQQQDILSETSTFSNNTELDGSLEEDWFKDDKQPHFTKDELGDELTSYSGNKSEIEAPKVAPAVVKSEPLYKQPVTQAKPVREPVKKVVKTEPTKSELKRNQIELDFDNQKNEATASQGEVAPKKEVEQQDPQVIVLSVVMPVNQQMLGAALLPSLLTLGLKYGEMNIFHRHEDSAGKGKVTFSLANIMNPGSFDLDSMENFATRGVSLFMTLPNAGDPLNVFEQMLNAAKQLAHEFNAQVIDENRNVMTKQTEQHYISKIREFDRKSRIALV